MIVEILRGFCKAKCNLETQQLADNNQQLTIELKEQIKLLEEENTILNYSLVSFKENELGLLEELEKANEASDYFLDELIGLTSELERLTGCLEEATDIIKSLLHR